MLGELFHSHGLGQHVGAEVLSTRVGRVDGAPVSQLLDKPSLVQSVFVSGEWAFTRDRCFGRCAVHVQPWCARGFRAYGQSGG